VDGRVQADAPGSLHSAHRQERAWLLCWSKDEFPMVQNNFDLIGGCGHSHMLGIAVCVSRETPSNGMRGGRVTDAIRTCNFDTETTDFYICGNSSMIDDTMKILPEKGSRNIYREQH